MPLVKAQKLGDSIIIVMPEALGVEEGEEFFCVRKDNGTIILVSKEEDHFANVAEGEYYMPELDAGYAAAEGEFDEI